MIMKGYHVLVNQQQVKELDGQLWSLVKQAHNIVLQQDLDLSDFRQRIAQLTPDFLMNLPVHNLTLTVQDVHWNFSGY